MVTGFTATSTRTHSGSAAAHLRLATQRRGPQVRQPELRDATLGGHANELWRSQPAASPSAAIGPMARESSPVMRSSLMTSAPIAPRCMETTGPARKLPRSSTFRPRRGRAFAMSSAELQRNWPNYVSARWLLVLPEIPIASPKSVPVALNAPHRAAHSRALPEAAGQEHAAHPDLPARRLRFRTLQGKPGRRVPARRVAAQVSRSVPHRMHSRASTGQSTGHAWLALGALCLPEAARA